jgi:hypothetical protein
MRDIFRKHGMAKTAESIENTRKTCNLNGLQVFAFW